MQLTCANCAARYLVDPAAIGPDGRTVQCFRCGHTWRANLPPEITMVADAPALAPAMPEPVPDVVIRPPEPSVVANLPAVAVRRRGPAWLKAAAIVLVMVTALAGGVYLVADRLIATLGIDERTAAIRLITGPDGRTALVIAGEIVNIGRGEAIARRLRVVFKDADGKPIAERALEIKPSPIPARGRVPFEARVDDAPARSASIGIRAD
jgi:predicted Zn finger-like uncharacterized protein